MALVDGTQGFLQGFQVADSVAANVAERKRQERLDAENKRRYQMEQQRVFERDATSDEQWQAEQDRKLAADEITVEQWEKNRKDKLSFEEQAQRNWDQQFARELNNDEDAERHNQFNRDLALRTDNRQQASHDALMEEQKWQAPIKRQIAQLELSNARDDRTQKKLEDTYRATERVRQRVKSTIDTSVAYAQGGEIDKARNELMKLQETGNFNLRQMTPQNMQRMDKAMEALLNPEVDMDFDSPDGQWVAKTLLEPQLKNSGRDMSKYNFMGLRRLDNGKLAIAMERKSDGKEVTTTLRQSTDSDDPVQMLEEEDLVENAKSWMGLTQFYQSLKNPEKLGTEIRATYAREGIGLAPLPEEQAQAGGAAGPAKPINPMDDHRTAAFVESYGDDGTYSGQIAKLIVQEPWFDLARAPQQVEEIRRIMDEDEDLSVPLAKDIYVNQQKIQAQVAASVEKAKVAYPGINEKRVRHLVEQWRVGRLDDREYEKRMQDLGKKASQGAKTGKSNSADEAQKLHKQFSDLPEAEIDAALKRVNAGELTLDQARIYLGRMPTITE